MTLLTDTELAEIEGKYRNYVDSGSFRVPYEMIGKLLSHIAALTSQLTDRNQAAHEALEKLGAANRERDSLQTQLTAATALAKRLADDAMVALAGSKIPTPEEGYLKSPHCLGADIKRLRQERDAATAELAAIKKPVEGEKLAAGAFEKFSRIMDSQGFLPLSKWELQSGVYQRAWREAIAFVRASADAERERKQPEAAESKHVIIHVKTVDGNPLGEDDVRLLEEYIDGQRNYVPTPIGAAIQSIRILCGFGMRQFAEICRMMPSSYADLEHGRTGWTTVSFETHQRILVELGKAAKVQREHFDAALKEASDLQAKLEAAEQQSAKLTEKARELANRLGLEIEAGYLHDAITDALAAIDDRDLQKQRADKAEQDRDQLSRRLERDERDMLATANETGCPTEWEPYPGHVSPLVPFGRMRAGLHKFKKENDQLRIENDQLRQRAEELQVKLDRAHTRIGELDHLLGPGKCQDCEHWKGRARKWRSISREIAQQRNDAKAECDQLRQRVEASSPDDLRDKGWAVAVHNDYRQGGENFTFWLFTKGGHAIKGEGRSDAEALDMVREAIAALLGQAEAANDRLAAELAEAKTKLAESERDCEQMACYEQERHELFAELTEVKRRLGEVERACQPFAAYYGAVLKDKDWGKEPSVNAFSCVEGNQITYGHMRELLSTLSAPHPYPSQGTQAGGTDRGGEGQGKEAPPPRARANPTNQRPTGQSRKEFTMQKRIEVHSQAEFDACIQAGNIAVVIGCRVEAWGNASVVAWDNASVEARGNASVEARGNASVVAWDNASVVARGNASVVAWDNASVVAWGNASVVAWGNASVAAWDNASVEARGNASVEAWGNASVEAWENASVEAWENASVVARGNVFVRLFSALRIKASAWVTIVKHGEAKEIEGGRQLDAAPEPTTGAEFCEFHGIDTATVDYKVENLDAKILEQVERDPGKLRMSMWHGSKCDETNWCNTTHCRAGYAVCLAGKAGFELERKYGAEMAGRMIYAVSRPEMELPNFFADDEEALADLRKCAAASAGH